ncbi:hypothetical protein CXB51_025290 [Gossypium anomalum]|uniref:NADH-quinone oxidoreductase subunit D domain-containing protein n=1 Tax=Gossypium anomalum TaxID=47600 RepID=A0A8J6CQA3_9ROSI|nr:hypothetical protein CXB51_025290 [Gossypium anomalum]
MNLSTKEKIDLIIVNMGPHHPSMHGVLRLIITLDGEDVVDCESILEAITVNRPKQLGNIQVLKRANYIITPFFYIFRERELVYDLFEAATYMRMMHNYFRIRDVATDLPYG